MQARPVILHVEDDSDLADTIAVALRVLGFHGTIINAAAADTALEIIRFQKEQNLPLDLIIVDMNLSNGTGLDIIRDVRSNPVWASIPILVLSNETDRETVAEAYMLGANCYFSKLASNTSGLGVVETLYNCWLNEALLPGGINNVPHEILGRAISLKAKIAEFYARLAHIFNGVSQYSRLWLDLSLNESNHANLLAFFNVIKGDLGIDRESQSELMQYVKDKEINFSTARDSWLANQKPSMDDALRSAFHIERSFDPAACAIAVGCLFPNSPAATQALKESTITHMCELANAARFASADSGIHKEAALLERRVEELRSTILKASST